MKLQSAEFDLGHGFPIPAEITTHRVGETNLLIAPTVPAWVTADDSEADAIQRLSRGASLREAIACLRSWGVIDPSEHLSRLLTRLSVEGFRVPQRCTAQVSGTTVQIHVTNACNLRCKHCYVSSGVPFPEEVGIDTWRNVLAGAGDRYKDVYVSISGGEPLLVPWLPDLMAFAKSRGMRVGLLSNGMLWTDKRIAQIGQYVDLVNVSLDGASDTVHDAIRGQGAFRQAVRGISRLGAAGIEVGINICLMRSNLADIEANFYQLIRSFPFRVSVVFAKYVEEGRGADDRGESISDSETSRILRLLASQFLSSDWTPTSIPRRVSCGFGRLFAFYANGDVSPCLSPRYIAGNILRESIDSVFNRIMQNAAEANVSQLPLCRTCDLRHICGGNCHLPQLTNGLPIAQNECSAAYREAFYAKLARRANGQREVMIPILSRLT